MKINNLYILLSFLIVISVFCLSIVSCGLDSSSQYNYQPPENIDDGLDTGSLNETGIDQSLIEKAVNDMARGKYGEVHSMLIYKDGKLIFEEYFPGHKYQWDAPNHYAEMVNWNSSMAHVQQSVTKSITSACIEIATDKGFIDSVGQSIFDYLPDHQDLKTDGKDKITIEHLLTMTSGLEWDEWSAPLSSADNDTIGIWFYGHDDPVRFILERPLVSQPGTSFIYSGGNILVLGEIVNNATGINIDEFSGKYLFEPSGIDSFDWWLRYNNDFIETASGLKMTPREMVKIGTIFLNGGEWNGKQIISDQWIKRSSTAYQSNIGIKIPGEDLGKVGYSYTWWTKEFSAAGKKINGYWANGWGGQKIMVFPELSSVVVFTGGNFTSKVQNLKILEKYILPAIS